MATYMAAETTQFRMWTEAEESHLPMLEKVTASSMPSLRLTAFSTVVPSYSTHSRAQVVLALFLV
jgi:hypothetical protein